MQTEVPANDAIPVDLLLQRKIPANMYSVFQCHEKSNLQKKGQIIENTENEKNQKTQQIQRNTENPKKVSNILELQEKLEISENSDKL